MINASEGVEPFLRILPSRSSSAFQGVEPAKPTEDQNALDPPLKLNRWTSLYEVNQPLTQLLPVLIVQPIKR